VLPELLSNSNTPKLNSSEQLTISDDRVRSAGSLFVRASKLNVFGSMHQLIAKGHRLNWFPDMTSDGEGYIPSTAADECQSIFPCSS
jgi:hypothetical protein